VSRFIPAYFVEDSYMAMHEHEIRKFIPILMESPFYLTLSLKERQSLLERLAGSYPFFDDERERDNEDEYD